MDQIFDLMIDIQVRVLEVEFGHWCKLFATRTRERRDIFKGLRGAADEVQKLKTKREELVKELEGHRKILPTCMGVAAGLPAAVQVRTLLQEADGRGGLRVVYMGEDVQVLFFQTSQRL